MTPKSPDPMAVVREALAFYASERNYYSMSVHEEGPAIEDDQGEKARLALAALDALTSREPLATVIGNSEVGSMAYLDKALPINTKLWALPVDQAVPTITDAMARIAIRKFGPMGMWFLDADDLDCVARMRAALEAALAVKS